MKRVFLQRDDVAGTWRFWTLGEAYAHIKSVNDPLRKAHRRKARFTITMLPGHRERTVRKVKPAK